MACGGEPEPPFVVAQERYDDVISLSS